jgi:hypothetical protein
MLHHMRQLFGPERCTKVVQTLRLTSARTHYALTLSQFDSLQRQEGVDTVVDSLVMCPYGFCY